MIGWDEPFYWKRLAVYAEHWQWFSCPIPIMAGGVLSGHVLFEAICEEAIKQFSLAHMVIVEAPSLEAYDRVDWSDIDRQWRRKQQQSHHPNLYGM